MLGGFRIRFQRINAALHNDVLLYTSTVPPQYPIRVDTSFYTASSSIANVIFWGALLDITPPSIYSYTAFGVPKEVVAPGGYGFTGREWDPETGLYYYRARYYDPKIGRFISEDPIGFEAGINFYAYVENNPVNLTDPSGLDAGSGMQGNMFGPPRDPECVRQCQQWILMIVGGGAATAAGQPVLGKSGGLAGGGSTQGTSPASRVMRCIIPRWRLPMRVMGTGTAGAALGRLVPWVGGATAVSGILAWTICGMDCPPANACSGSNGQNCE